MKKFYNSARLLLLVLLVLLAGATAGSLFAQVSIPSGGFSSDNVCPYTTDALPTGCQVVVNGNAIPASGGVLQLTASSGNQVASAWFSTPQTVVNGFSTTFVFQFSSPSAPPADGIAFVIQNAPAGLSSIGYTGANGGPIGYGGSDANGTDFGIPNSLAIEFDTYTNGWDPNSNHVAIQSCGTGNNTSHHTQNCDGSSVLTGYGNSNLGINPAPGIPFTTDGLQHTVTIQYNPPGTPCASSTSATNNLCIYLDQSTNPAPVLTASVDLSTIDPTNGTAYVGFTAATGGSFETQDILSWSFNQTVSAPLVLTAPTPLVFNNNPAQQIVETVDLSTVVTIHQPIPDPQIQSTNVVLSNVQWPPYVIGTPYSVSQIFPKDGDAPLGTGTGPFGSIFKDQCFNSTTPPADANCPSVDVSDTADFISIIDTFAFAAKGTLNFQPGTTVGVLEYVAKNTPTSDWNPLLPPYTVNPIANPVCPNTLGTSSNSNPAACDLNDIFVSLYGDNGSGASKTKTKGTFALVYDIPMPLTSFSVNGTTLNNPPSNTNSSVSLWFKSPLNLGFLVNPACPPSTICPVTPSPANNYFTPAPIVSESYQITDQTGTVVVVPTTSVPPPSGFSTASVVPVAFSASQSLTDGKYLLQYSAADNVGIVERNVQVVLLPGGPCTAPVSPFTFSAPCYQTGLFQSQVNVDNTAPQISGPTLSPAPATYNGVPNAYLLNQLATASFSCSDPQAGTPPVASGIATCGGSNYAGILTTPLMTSPVSTAATGNFNFPVSATDVAGNTFSSSASYTVVDQPVDVDIAHLAPSSVKPGSQVTYLVGVVNEAKKNIAYGVTLTIAVSLPTGASIASATPAGGTCSVSANVITCKIATLAPLNTFSAAGVLIVVKVPKTTTSGKISNLASVTTLNRQLDNDGNTSFSITVKN